MVPIVFFVPALVHCFSAETSTYDMHTQKSKLPAARLKNFNDEPLEVCGCACSYLRVVCNFVPNLLLDTVALCISKQYHDSRGV